ncbi:sulfurtransferase [hot springs metagenome]|uniref:Sulfurtransferase n=1 Tax=hot springs metagenome TaxID=433727 RepID=A0A5J4KX10_9ZZZZ
MRFKKHLVTLIVVSLFLASPALAGMLVDADWLKTHMDDPKVVIVDVQSKHDLYGKGHIPGAVKVARHIDLEDATRYPTNKYPQKEQFVNLMSRLGIDNDSIIIAYDDKYGLFASRFLVIMELYGHDINKLKLLDGGIKAWQAKGYQITAEATVRDKKAEYKTSGPNMNMIASWSDVYRDGVLRQNPDVVLHDARPVDEFSGNKIRAIRGGHIPGAINVTGVSAANNKDEQTFKSPSEIKKAFENAGVTPDKKVYTYCHSADRAAHAYIVLKHMLGYKDVKIYDGSWNEWATLTALPAEEEKWIAQSTTK